MPFFELVDEGKYTHVVTLDYLLSKLGTLGVPGAAALSKVVETSRLGRLEIPFRFGDIKLFVARKVADETARFMIDDLGVGGMFTSSLDADADGREGSTYVWTPDQLTEVLGDSDGRWAATAFGVTAAGTFEEGASVLQQPEDPEDPAA